MTSWELWASLKIARMPLSLILYPNDIAWRKSSNKFSLDDSAFVHRMFSLFFGLDYQPIKDRLTKGEVEDLDNFLKGFAKLPWREIPTHPHISNLDDLRLLEGLRDPVARLDMKLRRRTSSDPVCMIYRLWHRWPLVEPKQRTRPLLATPV